MQHATILPMIFLLLSGISPEQRSSENDEINLNNSLDFNGELQMGIKSEKQTISAEDYGGNNAHFLNEFMEHEVSMDEEYAMILDFIEPYELTDTDIGLILDEIPVLYIFTLEMAMQSELTVSQREIAAPTLLLNINIKYEEELSEIVYRYLEVVVAANKRKRLHNDDSPLNNWKYTVAKLAASRCFGDDNSENYIGIFQSYVNRFAAGHVEFLDQVKVK